MSGSSNNKIMVSVLCLAYNHEEYIEDALKGFVSQKTDFPFEVIVHDDASTDGTVDIIRKYQRMYPDIVKPIFQTENQYSKGTGITDTFVAPNAAGKYFAVCEGDDYWTDEKKLQKQVDYMESHPETVACVHNTRVMYMNKECKTKVIYSGNDKELGLPDVIEGGSQSFHTSSLMYKRELAFDKPRFLTETKGVGDYPMSIYLALSGDIHYIGDCMSVYRSGVKGSWSERIPNDKEKWDIYQRQAINMLIMANEYSYGKYAELFEVMIAGREFWINIPNMSLSKIIKSHEFWKLTWRQRVGIVLGKIR